MINRWKCLLVAALTFAASTPTLLAPGKALAATKVPFSDPSVDGAIGFCGPNNQPVTSGSLLTEPFVSKAVSTVPAPKGYTEAYITLFQPIQHEDPSIWTPYALTGVAKFNNPQHPAAQAITIDPPLLEPYNSMPPYWDGMYQIRMFFTSPEKAPVTTPYPAAVIQVKGKNWTLVSGGRVNCAASSAVSKLSSELPKSVIDTPQTIVVGGKKATVPITPAKTSSRKTPSSTASSTIPSGSATQGSRSSVTTGPSKQLASGMARSGGRGRGGGGSSAWWIALIATVVVLAGIGTTFGLKRRRSARS